MNVNWNKKYSTIAVYSFIVASAVVTFYLIASQIGLVLEQVNDVIIIFEPFTIGLATAYIFNFVLKFYEVNIVRDPFVSNVRFKSKRALSIILTYTTVVLIVYVFMQFVVPQLIESTTGLVNDIPMHIKQMTTLVDGFVKNLKIDERYQATAIKSWNNFVNYFIDYIKEWVPVVGVFLSRIASGVWNILLGIIISVYILFEKEKLCALSKKIVYAMFNQAHANKILQIIYKSHDTFGRFITGKILDSFIIGVLTFIVLTVFKIPYPILISVIIMVTNVIPFFGPFIGAIPSFTIILFVSPQKALWFLLIIFIIQQIDGNIIGPKILGDSIGIAPLWILFSVVIAGNLFGVIGMVIGVPLFAVLYSIIKEIVENKLRKKGLEMDTEQYM